MRQLMADGAMRSAVWFMACPSSTESSRIQTSPLYGGVTVSTRPRCALISKLAWLIRISARAGQNWSILRRGDL